MPRQPLFCLCTANYRPSPADHGRRAETGARAGAAAFTGGDVLRCFWQHMLVVTGALLVIMQMSEVSAASQRARTVDLELALLVDVSASVSDAEFRLQANGLAAAISDQQVLSAISRFASGGLAICIIQWSNNTNQQVAVSWRLISSRADALKFAAAVQDMPRLGGRGHTALGDALLFGLKELDRNRYDGKRRVMDLSGDGRANDGYPLRLARQQAIDNGITVNGLAILNELPLLGQYYQRYLIGGDGAFVMLAQDYDDFTRAMTAKLLREIRSLPLAYEGLPERLFKKAQMERGDVAW